jgi:phospholipid transport system substrate-binding protein
MRILRGLLLLLTVAVAAPSPSLAQTGEAGAFVQKLADDTVALLQTPGGIERDDQFRALMAQGFDVGFLGRQALARNWRTATEEERKAYEDIFDDYMLRTITSRLSRFEQERLKVTGERKDTRQDILVDSQIIGRGEPIAMEWRVRPMDGGLRVIDVKIEGISMLITTREEFAGIVQSRGMQGLLDAMKTKIEAMKAQATASR